MLGVVSLLLLPPPALYCIVMLRSSQLRAVMLGAAASWISRSVTWASNPQGTQQTHTQYAPAVLVCLNSIAGNLFFVPPFLQACQYIRLDEHAMSQDSRRQDLQAKTAHGLGSSR
jgi:hypothetical protein